MKKVGLILFFLIYSQLFSLAQSYNERKEGLSEWSISIFGGVKQEIFQVNDDYGLMRDYPLKLSTQFALSVDKELDEKMFLSFTINSSRIAPHHAFYGRPFNRMSDVQETSIVSFSPTVAYRLLPLKKANIMALGGLSFNYIFPDNDYRRSDGSVRNIFSADELMRYRSEMRLNTSTLLPLLNLGFEFNFELGERFDLVFRYQRTIGAFKPYSQTYIFFDEEGNRMPGEGSRTATTSGNYYWLGLRYFLKFE